MTSNPKDPMFDKVDCVLVEPSNSGTAVLDKLGYLLQEEGAYFPFFTKFINLMIREKSFQMIIIHIKTSFS